MDTELANVITYLKSIKLDLYKKYKPELIDGKNAILNQTPVTTVDDPDESSNKALTRLMQQQQRILYRGNIVAQEAASQRTQQLMVGGQPPMTPSAPAPSRPKIVLTLKNKAPDPDILPPPPPSQLPFPRMYVSSQTDDRPGDFRKPWNKLPANLKVQAMLKFIDALRPILSDEQKNQLRFLLASAISEKKLCKITEVVYDVDKGCVTHIPQLTYTMNGHQFQLSDEPQQDQPFPFSVVSDPTLSPPVLVKKKLILKK
uniref:Uncharacterized protein n=1 Tax=viral metagenome TaxID=1070528 RepID=A0A6C0BLW5_9ZZZZ